MRPEKMRGDETARLRRRVTLRKLESRRHRLDLGVVVEDELTHLAAPAGFLVAAKRQRSVEHVVAIDPHRAGANALGELVGLGDFARPDACGEAVIRTVGLVYDSVEVGIGDRCSAHHRTEDFLAHHLHVRLGGAESFCARGHRGFRQ